MPQLSQKTRVLVTASLETIKERFAVRMHRNLPASVASMLERKYGQFEATAHDLRVDTDTVSAEEAANSIQSLLNERKTVREERCERSPK